MERKINHPKRYLWLSALLAMALFAACHFENSTLNRDGTGQVLQRKGNICYQGAVLNGRSHGYGVLWLKDSMVYAGQWKNGKRQGMGTAFDAKGRKITGRWNADTLVSGRREDGKGVYVGSFNRKMMAWGHGEYTGNDGSYYEGRWENDAQTGKGFALTAHPKVKVGEWKAGQYLGERLTYTTERIYGIDISKYQHVIKKRVYPIKWNQLRITHLGTASRKAIHGQVNYPISFIYIKSTEGKSLLNPFYKADYKQARAHGFSVGTYHFFSIYSPAAAQAAHFLRHSHISKGDFPPVLDVEPSPQQIAKMGGPEVLFKAVRTWLTIVEQRMGRRPILYISQQFVNRYLPLAPDIKRDYDIWIARYGEYKPDVHLVYWQLCPDGRVQGIQGEVDINVFNGYKEVFEEFKAKL